MKKTTFGIPTLFTLQALRIVSVAVRARASRSASDAASETNATALRVLGSRAARWRTRRSGAGRRSGRRARGFRRGAGARGRGRPSGRTAGAASDA